MAKYSITKDPAADNIYSLAQKDLTATAIEVTKNPGNDTVTFQKNAASKARIVKAGGGAFAPNAVHFENTVEGSTWFERDADLTSLTNTSVGTISFWFKKETDAKRMFLWQSQAGFLDIEFPTNNLVQTRMKNVAGAINVSIISTSTITISDGWVHVYAGWDVTDAVAANNTAVMRINGVDDSPTVIKTQGPVDYTRTDHGIGSNVGGGSLSVDADVAQLYINTDAYVSDVTQFISGGKPVDLGSDGSGPSGSQPVVYMPNEAASYATNAGYGGNFVAKGTTGVVTDVSGPAGPG